MTNARLTGTHTHDQFVIDPHKTDGHFQLDDQFDIINIFDAA